MSNVETQCIYNYSKLRCYSMSNSETYKYVAWPVCSHVYLKFFRCKSLSLVFTWLNLPRKALLPAINQPNENMSHQRGTDHQTWGPTCRNWPLRNVIFPFLEYSFSEKWLIFRKSASLRSASTDVKSRSREGANNEVSALQHRALQIRSPSFFLSCSQIKAQRIGLQLSVRFFDWSGVTAN